MDGYHAKGISNGTLGEIICAGVFRLRFFCIKRILDVLTFGKGDVSEWIYEVNEVDGEEGALNCWKERT